MRSPSRTLRSTPISNRSLGSAASVGGRTLLVHRGLKKTRECRGRKFPSDRKVARRYNHFVAVAARAWLQAHEDHLIGRTRLIRSGRLLRTPEQVRSFGDRNR